MNVELIHESYIDGPGCSPHISRFIFRQALRKFEHSPAVANRDDAICLPTTRCSSPIRSSTQQPHRSLTVGLVLGLVVALVTLMALVGGSERAARFPTTHR